MFLFNRKERNGPKIDAPQGGFLEYEVRGGYTYKKKELQHAARHPAALCRESLLPLRY